MNSMKNRVNLIGPLGNNPDFKELDKGSAVANFSMATHDSYKNAKGERVEDTQWHRVVAWGKTAEYIRNYAEKGKTIAVDGRLVHRNYEDKDGNTRYITEVVANEVVLLTPKPEGVEAQG